MNIDKMIEQWEEKHSSLLEEYSKGNANNEVMQMYRSQMKNVLDFISQLKQVKNCFIPTVSNSLPVDFLQNEMIKAIKELAKESTAPDKDTPDWLESDIKRGAKWMYKRLTGNDC